MPLHLRFLLAGPGPALFVAAGAVLLHGTAHSQAGPDAGIELRLTPALQPPPRGDAAKKLPIVVRAQKLSGRPDLDTLAEGDAELRQGSVVVRADRVTYDYAGDLAHALGNVRVSQSGNIYTGPEAQLELQRFEGFFISPTYYFARTAAGGTAARIDFLDEQRAVATAATYTSCPADGSGDPAWLLSTDRVSMDFATNEGVAENAVLRFYGVPILGAPRLSFPLTDERKSGWLPPSFSLDSKSGFQFSIPYYWNIAPNRDATFTPTISSRRGPGLDSEFRYLEPGHHGTFDVNLMPHDNLTGDARYSLAALQETELPRGGLVRLDLLRVSDDDYWKDFPRSSSILTPRLLSSSLQASQPLGDWTTYANVQSWQVLQTTDPTTRIAAPYEREPQVGTRYAGRMGPGLQLSFETELNRFVNPTNWTGDPSQPAQVDRRPIGLRLHALGSISRPFGTPGWTVTPKLSFNAASYSLDSAVGDIPRNASRVIPTASVESAWVFERDTTWFGKPMRQTLEPRLLYVNTPFRDQSRLPNFDAAPKDFNFESYFSENTLTGVDRVSDSHQVTAGVITRFLDPDSGAEALRLGLAQRYLLRDQRVTLKPDGTADAPSTQRFSDLLLLASTNMVPNWNLDTSVQYSPDVDRTIRSIVGVRYSPGPFRTISTTYRFTRDLSEQVELGWQWPIYGRTPLESRGATDRSRASLGDAIGGSASGGAGCSGSWYSVGRVNYSTRDSRITDSIVGFEYDAGCWIGRIVAERLSTGRSDASTRLLLQLELVGLSRLGSNPLQVLKDNIPGYRLLRDERPGAPSAPVYDE